LRRAPANISAIGVTGKKDRDERLAAALRENLRRRKAQARANPEPEPDAGKGS